MDIIACLLAIALLTSMKVWASRRGYRGGREATRRSIGLPSSKEYILGED